MKRYNDQEFLRLQDSGYKYLVFIKHTDKAGATIGYLYPFKNEISAFDFSEECMDELPLIINLQELQKYLDQEPKDLKIYTASIKELYLRAAYFDNSEINFTLFDKELNIIDVNESLLRDFHLEREKLIGKNHMELSSNAKEMYDKFMEVIRTGKSIVFEEIKGDLQYGGRYNRVKAFKVGNGVGVSSSNITHFKEIIKTLEMFAYKSSHDIRSPINSILGLLNLINEFDEKDPKKLREYFDIIQKQVQRLEGLSRILLETLKNEKPHVNFEVIKFKGLLTDVKQMICFMDGFDEVEFKEEIAEINDFHFDITLLASLFQNLIDNAIKYRRKGGGAFVKITIEKKEDFLKIVVADNGIGIEDAKQKNIFNLFYRAANEISGTGLGLYTIKSSLESLGGHVSLISKENVGSEFSVFLPYTKNNLQS